ADFHRFGHVAAVGAQNHRLDVIIQGGAEFDIVESGDLPGQNDAVSVADDGGGRCWRGCEQRARCAEDQRAKADNEFHSPSPIWSSASSSRASIVVSISPAIFEPTSRAATKSRRLLICRRLSLRVVSTLA